MLGSGKDRGAGSDVGCTVVLEPPGKGGFFLCRTDANPAVYFARLGLAFAFDLAFTLDALRSTAARMSALNACGSISSSGWMSMARLTFPPRLALKSPAG